MSAMLQNTASVKLHGWLKEKVRDPNMYCALAGVAALAVIELVVFAG
ncbi:MAG: hypothetical protein VYD53_12295 [Pseudomonadota bacterium]|nr:hypothetical protein [Pseudomonadota bacterium]